MEGTLKRHPASSHDSVMSIGWVLNGHWVKELVNGVEVAGPILGFGTAWVAWLLEAFGV